MTAREKGEGAAPPLSPFSLLLSLSSMTSDTLPYGIAPPGYRLPAATHIGPVTLQVADLARSIDYYERVLGLRVIRGSPGSAMLGTQDGMMPLVILHERPGAAPVPKRGRLGLYHFAILLPDRAALGRFARHLADSNMYAGMSDHLVSEAMYLTDPDGLGIEVYADRPRTEWKHEGRQLLMALDPLDVDGIIAAAQGERWNGMPAGTIMGHIHLYVGDLEDAARFYHAGLGFDKTAWSLPGALFLSAGGYHHHLGTNTWAAGAPPAAENDARLLEWEIRVPGATAATGALDSLRQAGVSVERSADGGVARDPWGTVVRIRNAEKGESGEG
jgi:catechol 2,3-dioxygenase